MRGIVLLALMALTFGVRAETVVLTNAFGSATVDTVGALVLSYVPRDGREVFFRPAAPRDVTKWYNGGVPVCWPWFNQQGDPGSARHGFAWQKAWTLVSCTNGVSASRALLRLEEKGNYRLDYEIVLGQSLSLRLRMTNLGSERFAVTTGFHPYFAVSHPKNVTVEFPDRKLACTPGLDKAYRYGDGVYGVLDRSTGRRLMLRTSGHNKVIVWNPGTEQHPEGLGVDEWQHFVGVEPVVIPRAEGFFLHPGETRSLGLSCVMD